MRILQKILSLLWMGVVCLPLVHAEIVYDNVQTTQRIYYTPYGGTNEFGDEVNLVGEDRILTTFELEYFGDFPSYEKVSMRVRFYANNGESAPGVSNAAPKTLLYESDVIKPLLGFNTLSLRGLNLKVPDNFTWTCQMEGVKGVISNRVALAIYDPPTVGHSYNDFWQKLNNKWGLYHFSRIKANFAARIVTRGETPMSITSLNLIDPQHYQVSVKGPAYRQAILQRSCDSNIWQDVHHFFFMGKAETAIHELPANSVPGDFRLVAKDDPGVRLLMTDKNATNAFMRISGPPGTRFVIQSSGTMSGWLPMISDQLVAGVFDWTDTYVSNAARKYYRLKTNPFHPVTPDYEYWKLFNWEQIPFLGTKGHDCRIEISTNLVDWTILSTNTFSFTEGRTSVRMDKSASQVFYKVTALGLLANQIDPVNITTNQVP